MRLHLLLPIIGLVVFGANASAESIVVAESGSVGGFLGRGHKDISGGSSTSKRRPSKRSKTTGKTRTKSSRSSCKSRIVGTWSCRHFMPFKWTFRSNGTFRATGGWNGTWTCSGKSYVATHKANLSESDSIVSNITGRDRFTMSANGKRFSGVGGAGPYSCRK